MTDFTAFLSFTSVCKAKADDSTARHAAQASIPGTSESKLQTGGANTGTGSMPEAKPGDHSGPLKGGSPQEKDEPRVQSLIFN